jgi:type IV pilus assembly protein PilM
MPLSSSFVTVMSLNAEATEDISSRVRVEARKYIPIPIAEVTLDWAEVESGAQGEGGTREVLLAAIQNDALARFNGLLDTVELSRTPIEIECFSVIRSLYEQEDGDVAIIDVGATSTKLYIVRSGLLQRMYRVRSGGSLFTEKLATELGYTFEQAEVLKRTITNTDENFNSIQKQHHQFYDRVIKEFKQVIDEYEKLVQTQIGTIYFVGGASQFPGFSNFVGTVLSRKVVSVTPFNKVAYPAFMEDTMNSIGATFAVALGAALRSFE